MNYSQRRLFSSILKNSFSGGSKKYVCQLWLFTWEAPVFVSNLLSPLKKKNPILAWRHCNFSVVIYQLRLLIVYTFGNFRDPVLGSPKSNVVFKVGTYSKSVRGRYSYQLLSLKLRKFTRKKFPWKWYFYKVGGFWLFYDYLITFTVLKQSI